MINIGNSIAAGYRPGKGDIVAVKITSTDGTENLSGAFYRGAQMIKEGFGLDKVLRPTGLYIVQPAKGSEEIAVQAAQIYEFIQK